MRTLTRWLITFVALAPAGACNAGSRCLRTSDCAAGYQCGMGECQLRSPPPVDASLDAADATASSGGTTALDSGAGGASAGGAGKAGASGDAGAEDDAGKPSDAGLSKDAGDAGYPDAADASDLDAF